MKPLTVQDIINELKEFDPKAKIKFEVNVRVDGEIIYADYVEYSGISKRLGYVVMGLD